MQSRDARTRRVDGSIRRPGPPPSSSRGNPWQVIAIIALIVAAAGWTTVVILGSALASRPETAAIASPTESFDDTQPSDDSEVPPVADTHDAPELEAVLPHEFKGTALQIQSWTGDSILLENDTWSDRIRTYLTSVNKAPTDLRGATADDPNQVLQESLSVYQVVGVPGDGLRDALVAAWRVDYPDLKVTQVTLGDKVVTKLDFADDTIDSYIYLRGDQVFDIETTDDAVALAALAALPAPTGSGAPAPAGSGAPSSKAPASKAPAASPS